MNVVQIIKNTIRKMYFARSQMVTTAVQEIVPLLSVNNLQLNDYAMSYGIASRIVNDCLSYLAVTVNTVSAHKLAYFKEHLNVLCI